LVEVSTPIFPVTVPGESSARAITKAEIKNALDAVIGAATLQGTIDGLLDNPGGYPGASVSGTVQSLQSSHTQAEEWFMVFEVSGMAWSVFQHRYSLMNDIDQAVITAGNTFTSGTFVTITCAANYGNGELQTTTFQSSISASSDQRASSKGDPHLVNMHGQRFDLYQPGVHVLLQVPRRAKPQDTLLRVEADAQRMGAACADLYFEALNITGSWSGQAEGLQFLASTALDHKDSGSLRAVMMDWRTFGTVDLKVIRGHTNDGIVYLNLFVRHLSGVGLPVGGLLGEDDHTAAATPGADCSQSMDLHARGSPTASVAMMED
jgi:hypothetical protein